MKKIFTSFTFWLLILSLFLIYIHQIGQDSFNIILIGLNPILSFISNFKEATIIMDSGLHIPCNTVAGSISLYWYIGVVITFLLYGALIDLIKAKIIKNKITK